MLELGVVWSYWFHPSTTLLEGRKNHSRNTFFNCLQLVIELGPSSFNHIIASPDRDKGNNLYWIVFWLTLGLSKDLQIVMKSTKCMFGSSPGKPPKNTFRFRSLIMVLVMMNFSPGANGGGMIAPAAPAPSIPLLSSSVSYWTGYLPYLPRTWQFLLTFCCIGWTSCSDHLGFCAIRNSSSPTLRHNCSGDVLIGPNFVRSPEPWIKWLDYSPPILQPFSLSVEVSDWLAMMVLQNFLFLKKRNIT